MTHTPRDIDVAERGIGSIGAFDGNGERLVVGIDELGETGQWYDGATELAPVGGVAIAFLAPMDVQRTDEGSALTRIVVDAKILESGIVLSTKVALRLVLVAECLQATAGHEELFCLCGHAVVAEQVAKDFEVLGLVGTGILWDFLEVGERTPLALLMGDDGRAVGLLRLIVAGEEQLLVVVVIARRGVLVPIETAGTSLDVELRTVIPCPAAAYAGSGIQLCGVVLLHGRHPVVAVSDPVASGLIACRHETERGMVTVLVDDALGFVHQVLVYLLSTTQLHPVVRPRRSFGLQIDAHAVGSSKGRLRWTVAVETDVVQSVLLTFLEDAQPLSLVGRRIARLGKAAVLYRAAQKEWAVVDQ